MPLTTKAGMDSAKTTAAKRASIQAQALDPPPALASERWSGLILAGGYGTLLILLAVFSHNYWLSSDQGRHKLRDLRAALQVQKAHNAQVEQRNAELAELINRLKLDDNALEEHARYDLGMIRRGETFIRVLEADTR